MPHELPEVCVGLIQTGAEIPAGDLLKAAKAVHHEPLGQSWTPRDPTAPMTDLKNNARCLSGPGKHQLRIAGRSSSCPAPPLSSELRTLQQSE